MAQETQNVTSPIEPTSPASPDPTASPTRQESEQRRIAFQRSRSSSQHHLDARTGRRKSSQAPRDRPPATAYHDSRAATRAEFSRRASTLQEYYQQNPHLLPQLPFTFRHGFKRWKLIALITLIVIDASVVPIVLYYAMTFAGNVEGWIVFAVVATIWGGPTYVEFAVRSWRLILKTRFFRPLGASSRWCFDISHWIFVITITTTTALLVIGSAPHVVWLRVLSMPGPGLLYGIAGPLLFINIWEAAGWKAPFRLSSTAKGEAVRPGVYYLVEDIVAVNAGGGLPFREGLAARYEASPVFRKMLRDLSHFWTIPALIVAIACTVVACIHEVPAPIGYGIGWGVPFVWATIWAAITVPWVRREMQRENATWRSDEKLEKGEDTPPTIATDTPV